MKFEHSWTGNWANAFRGLRHPMESYAKSDSKFGIASVDFVNDEYDKFIIKSFPDYDKLSKEEQMKIFNFYDANHEIQYYPLYEEYEYAFVGPNDLDLAKRMIKAGTPNDKFLRQIFVSVDITAPLYWWKEMDTYKVATVANSTSTMHKLASTPITLDCFEIDDYNPDLVFEEGKDDSGDYPYFYGCSIGDCVGTKEIEVHYSETLIGMLESLRRKYLETKDKRYWKELIRWLPEGWLQTRTWTANYSTLRNIIRWRTGHKLTEWESFIKWCRTLPYADSLLFYNQPFDN